MNLRQLRYLVAVSREGGIRAAARSLHLSQPQISHAVSSLEEELGVELMRRTPRGVEVTAEGEELIARAEDIVGRVDAAELALRGMADERSRTLRVGVLAGVLSAGELLPPILAGYRRDHPDVVLELEDLAFCDQVTPVLEGRVDAAIVRLPLNHPELAVTPLAVEPRVVMVGASHELAAEESVDVEDVIEFPTLPLDSPIEWSDYWQLNDFRGGSNCDPEIAPVRTVPDAQLAVGTRDVVISSPAALRRLALNPMIRTVPLTGATPSTIAVVHRRRPDATVRRFVETAQAMAERNIGLMPDGAIPNQSTG
jgi:DNA-binding transcriptional LysR family regulator